MTNFELISNIEQYTKEKMSDRFDEKFFNLINALNNKISKEITVDDTCFFYNDECTNNGKSIGSHLFQENGVLSKISLDRKVIAIREQNYGAPYRYDNKIQNINSTMKYPVFCSHHDQNVFKDIESTQQEITEGREAYLYTVKIFAFYLYEVKQKIAICSWYLDNTECSELNNIFDYLEYNDEQIINYFETLLQQRKDLSYELEQGEKYKKKFMDIDVNKEYESISVEEIFISKEGIVFGCFIPVEDEVYFSVNVVPHKTGSRIIITYFKDDYNMLSKDQEFVDFISGNIHPVLSQLVLLNKENICFDPKVFVNLSVSCINSLQYVSDFWFDFITPNFFEVK